MKVEESASKVKVKAVGEERERKTLPQTPAAEATFWGRNLNAEVKELGVHATWVEVTPDLAKTWLGRNRRNRHASPAIIERYARDMANGAWLFNSQALTFSSTGRLLNGQNRLQACLRAGVPFQTLVIFGLPEDCFIAEDTGKRRSRKDRLDIQDEERTSLLSAAIGWVYRYERGKLGSVASATPSPAEEQDTLKRHPRLRDSVAVLSRSIYHAIGMQGMLAALHYVMVQRDETLADAFFDGLGTGTMIRESDPVYQLRKRLIANRTSTRKLSSVEAPALVIKAWNQTREGREIQQLGWRPAAEPFPEIE